MHANVRTTKEGASQQSGGNTHAGKVHPLSSRQFLWDIYIQLRLLKAPPCPLYAPLKGACPLAGGI